MASPLSWKAHGAFGEALAQLVCSPPLPETEDLGRSEEGLRLPARFVVRWERPAVAPGRADNDGPQQRGADRPLEAVGDGRVPCRPPFATAATLRSLVSPIVSTRSPTSWTKAVAALLDALDTMIRSAPKYVSSSRRRAKKNPRLNSGKGHVRAAAQAGAEIAICGRRKSVCANGADLGAFIARRRRLKRSSGTFPKAEGRSLKVGTRSRESKAAGRRPSRLSTCCGELSRCRTSSGSPWCRSSWSRRASTGREPSAARACRRRRSRDRRRSLRRCGRRCRCRPATHAR